MIAFLARYEDVCFSEPVEVLTDLQAKLLPVRLLRSSAGTNYRAAVL